MREYIVTWATVVDAVTPREAAELAREKQFDPHTPATVFEVADSDGRVYEVDLNDFDSDVSI